MFKTFRSYVFAAAIGVTLAGASVFAQDSETDERRSAPTTTSRTNTTDTDDDDGFNYGWLGLAGLVGLLGLMPRSKPETAFTMRDGGGNVKQQGRA